jgi:hypothetical protein
VADLDFRIPAVDADIWSLYGELLQSRVVRRAITCFEIRVILFLEKFTYFYNRTIEGLKFVLNHLMFGCRKIQNFSKNRPRSPGFFKHNYQLYIPTGFANFEDFECKEFTS